MVFTPLCEFQLQSINPPIRADLATPTQEVSHGHRAVLEASSNNTPSTNDSSTTRVRFRPRITARPHMSPVITGEIGSSGRRSRLLDGGHPVHATCRSRKLHHRLPAPGGSGDRARSRRTFPRLDPGAIPPSALLHASRPSSTDALLDEPTCTSKPAITKRLVHVSGQRSVPVMAGVPHARFTHHV